MPIIALVRVMAIELSRIFAIPKSRSFGCLARGQAREEDVLGLEVAVHHAALARRW
ncbi:MAG: hypothetical protein R3A52_14365 [Polyangiales bacterium]